MTSPEHAAFASFIDSAALQGVGTFMLGVAALLTIIGAFVNRSAIGTGLRLLGEAIITPRIVLVERAERAERRRTDAVDRADASEHTADSWQSAYEAMKAQIDAAKIEIAEMRAENLQARAEMAVLKERNDALADYVEGLFTFAVQIEAIAAAAKVDLGDLRMPPVPAIIADRFRVPETLR